MENNNTKEFYGRLYTVKDNKYLGIVFCSIEINKNLPVKANIYFKNVRFLRDDFDINHLRIVTEASLVYLDFYNTNFSERSGGYEASAIYGKPSRILFVKNADYLNFENLNKNESEVTISINSIEHLDYGLNSYKVDILNNLNNIGETNDKYKYSFGGYLNKFVYEPQVETIQDNVTNEFSFYFKHTLKFILTSSSNHVNFIKHINDLFHPIYFVFSILSRYDFDYRSIFLKRIYRNKKYRYDLYQKEDVNNTGRSNLGINGQDFLQLVDMILLRFAKMSPKEKFVFRVVCNRLTQIKKERDISLNITFWHVIVTHLIKLLIKGEYFKLSTIEEVKKVLIKLQIDDSVAEVIVETNRLRNDHFKKLTFDKEMGNITNTYNSFIQNVFVKLFSKLLELDSKNEDTLRKIFWNVYNVNFKF